MLSVNEFQKVILRFIDIKEVNICVKMYYLTPTQKININKFLKKSQLGITTRGGFSSLWRFSL